MWRRGWDSNPRAGYPTRRFRGAPVTTTSVPLRSCAIEQRAHALRPRLAAREGQGPDAPGRPCGAGEQIIITAADRPLLLALRHGRQLALVPEELLDEIPALL